MFSYPRIKNKIVARIITRFPSLAKRLVDSYIPRESEDIPWTPITKPLHQSRVALITTAGVHHKTQTPFDMQDPDGDPTYREINAGTSLSDLMITHDYYDHADADKDMSIVFPLDRLNEFQQEKIIGPLADFHYSFMGHIDGPHVSTLITRSAPEIARKLKAGATDIALLTPG
ncbi:MAG: glycine/sarcosine/betaine reductase selenoprotein B family protein [Desulfobacterales bacterium]|nr:glycine/sarcosine/betaine reductase selenoprotein B family protein [Desulfobacterales bacterium]